MNYDIRFKTPFSLILSGASGSGKTTWLEHFLSIFDKITDGKGKYEKLLWFSGTNQPDLFKRIKSNFKGTTRVFDSIDNEIYSKIEKEGKNSIISTPLCMRCLVMQTLGNYLQREDHI